MPLTTTPALVLQTFPYSETSKVLRLYTLEHGMRSVIAKGALRPRSRFGGILEPFTEGSATFYLREGRDLHTLSGFDLVRSRQALGRSLGAFAGASLMAELAMRFATEETQSEVYGALTGGWDALVAAEGEGRAFSASLAGAWALVSLLGFGPQTEVCVSCGRAVAADEPVRFDAAAGGIACTRCRAAGRLLDPVSRAELRAMTSGGAPAGAPARPGVHCALLRAFLEAQVHQERPLRALELFLEHAPPGPAAAG